MEGALRTWVGRLALVMLAVMAAGFLALGVAEAWADSPTFDEPVYVSAGLAAVASGTRAPVRHEQRLAAHDQAVRHP